MAFGNEQSNERVKTLLSEVWFELVRELCLCDDNGGCTVKMKGFSENLCSDETYPSLQFWWGSWRQWKESEKGFRNK